MSINHKRNSRNNSKTVNHKTASERNRQTIITRETYRGPLPPAAELTKYENAHSGAGKIIFDEFQIQRAHSRSMESQLVASDIFTEKAGVRKQTRGQWFGFIVSFVIPIFTITGSFWLISIDKDIIGVPTLIASFAFVIKLFYNKTSN